jgi:pyruvate kinase
MPIRQVEPLGKVRTKIVATVGPSSRDPSVMREMIDAGVDVFRLNFSHGKQEEHTATLRTIRTVAEECGRIIAVLQDLGGPKIRVGPIPGDAVDCGLGDVFTVVCDRTSDDPRQLTCTYRDLPKDLKAGDVVLFADGAVIMVATECHAEKVTLKVTLPGRLKSNQGLNLPGAALNVKALTEKDLRDLDWSAWHRVEYIGLSFVRQAADITWLRQELDRRGSRARIVAKIEKPQALDNLDAIIEQSDVLMVARGDLGVEMDVSRVPAIQKKVIAACHKARVPVITATQMLNSMETSNRPTRAEATDVFNAVLDGTDAVMLSGETAVGQYPVEAVATMSQIATEAEALMFAHPETTWTIPTLAATATGKAHAGSVLPITESVVQAASLVSRRLGAALLVAVTHSGRTALVVSKQRNQTPTIALTDDAETARALSLNWGVTPLYRPEVNDVPTALAATVDWARGLNLLTTGDRIVILRGTMPGNPTHNALSVHVVE